MKCRTDTQEASYRSYCRAMSRARAPCFAMEGCWLPLRRWVMGGGCTCWYTKGVVRMRMSTFHIRVFVKKDFTLRVSEKPGYPG